MSGRGLGKSRAATFFIWAYAVVVMAYAAVFLDRDDTLIATREATLHGARVGDLSDASLVRLLPGVAGACAKMRSAGYGLVIVSNQGCVARGNASLGDVERVNERVCALLLEEGGVDVSGVYCCPFHPDGTVVGYSREHDWRKPSAGMVIAAAGALGIDLQSSWLVGDALRDLECGRRAGIAEDRLLHVGDDGVMDIRAAGDLIAGAGFDVRAWPSGLAIAGTCWPAEVAELDAGRDGR